MKKYILIFLCISSELHSYLLMIDVNTPPEVSTTYKFGEQFTTLEFQPALTPYKVVFRSYQVRRLLSAIKKYHELRQKAQKENRDINQQLMVIAFDEIQDQTNKISAENPSLTVYFRSVEQNEYVLMFSVGRIEKGVALAPEIFSFGTDVIALLEEELQLSYLAQK